MKAFSLIIAKRRGYFQKTVDDRVDKGNIALGED